MKPSPAVSTIVVDDKNVSGLNAAQRRRQKRSEKRASYSERAARQRAAAKVAKKPKRKIVSTKPQRPQLIQGVTETPAKYAERIRLALNAKAATKRRKRIALQSRRRNRR